jgi:DMSO/TMAO reductase YedYZ molybdopterin-dependent catalytic subunit
MQKRLFNNYNYQQGDTMQDTKKNVQPPHVLVGILVGGLAMMAVTALLFLGWRLLNLPFLPLDIFDWLARVLPGDVIRLGTASIVGFITTFNLGQTDQVAKVIEQWMGVGMLLGLGAVAGLVLFVLHRLLKSRYLLTGAVVGLLLGGALLLVNLAIPQSVMNSPAPILGILWVLGLMLGWGVLVSWSYSDMAAMAPAAAANDADTNSKAVTAVNRRQFLVRLGGATATITVVGGALGAWLGVNTDDAAAIDPLKNTNQNTDGTDPLMVGAARVLPNANDAVIPANGTRPEFTPVGDHYRIDINTRAQRVDLATWTLPFSGLVEAPIEFTMEQLRTEFTTVEQFVTLACISNNVGGQLIGTQLWTGARFSEVLARAKPSPEAKYIHIRAVDGFDEYVSIDEINNDPRCTLTYDWDNLPLTAVHGAPLRVYLPNRFGMKQPKWITSMEVVAEWAEGYWVRRGWDADAYMLSTSVIDTIAVDDTFVRDGVTYVPIGGIAHAGDRGISKVQISVDDGDWVDAQIRTPLSQTTWAIWRYDYPFTSGNHTFAVRCINGDGEAQIETARGVAPSGATGIHRERTTL